MHITINVVSSNPVHCEVNSMQHYVIKVVSDLRQVSCFLRIFSVSPTNKTDLHDITEILLKVALGIINLNTTEIMHAGSETIINQ